MVKRLNPDEAATNKDLKAFVENLNPVPLDLRLDYEVFTPKFLKEEGAAPYVEDLDDDEQAQ